MNPRMIKILLCALALVCGATWSQTVWSQAPPVRAKIGIQINSGGTTTRAKPSQAIAAGDRLRLFAQPEGRAFVYMVRTDATQATLLNRVQQVNGQSLALPSAGVMREEMPMAASMGKKRLVADESRFAEDLPFFSGQEVLVKKYAFAVQK